MTREQSVANFTKNIDELIESNYILASKKISLLLKGVSSSKLFFELFEHCTADFNYNDAKKRAIVSASTYGAGRFIMPKDSRSIIAFVFLLLCEVDMNEMGLLNLLETCFFEGGYNESFRRFAKEVLTPFKNEVMLAVSKMLNTTKYSLQAVEVKKVEKPVLTDAQSLEIKKYLNESKAIILQYKMEAKLKAELLALYDNFTDALYGTDRDRLKLSFLGYKYSTLYHRKLDVSVGEIEKLLIGYGILDEFN